MCCSVLQCVAVCDFEEVIDWEPELQQCVAVCLGLLKCVAVCDVEETIHKESELYIALLCCSVFEFVAVCCSV